MKVLEPISKIKMELGIDSKGDIHKFFTQECSKKMIPYIPYRGGSSYHLNEDVDVEYNYIDYNAPYAHYMYEGIVYVMPHNGKAAYYSPSYGYWSEPGEKKVPTSIPIEYHTPGTGSHWDKRMWAADGEKVVKAVQKEIDRRG